MASLQQLIAHPDAVWLLQERLLSMRGDSTEKLQVQEALVQACFSGGDREMARRYLEAAFSLASRMGRAADTTRLRRRLALHQLRIGLPELAAPLLTMALRDALEGDDTLSVVALSSTLSAMHLDAEDWAEAHRLAGLLIAAATQRGNWIGIADGLITQAACLAGLSRPLPMVLSLLLQGGKDLNERGALAAVNLLKARLGELRALHGPEVFDAALQEALRQLRAATPQAT